MSYITSFRLLGAAAVTLTLAGGTAASAAKPAPVSLRTAKTVRYHATFKVGGMNSAPAPFFALTVDIQRPGKVRVEAAYEHVDANAKPKNALYVTDGAQAHEFISPQNAYTEDDAPRPGGSHASSQLCLISGVDVVLRRGEPLPAREGITRTTERQAVDGREMIVYRDAEPAHKGPDGSEWGSNTTTLVEAATGLPYRITTNIVHDGKETPNLQTDFSDWRFNEPIPASRFAWKTPEGAKLLEGPKTLPRGSVAPDFSVQTPEGKVVKLSDYKGKLVIVDFWATWCGPCQRSMPHLQKLYEAVKGQDVQVLAVCVSDKRDAYNQWVAKNRATYTFPTAYDPAGVDGPSISSSLYKGNGIPLQYLVGKDGKVLAGVYGYVPGVHPVDDALKALGIKVPSE